MCYLPSRDPHTREGDLPSSRMRSNTSILLVFSLQRLVFEQEKRLFFAIQATVRRIPPPSLSFLHNFSLLPRFPLFLSWRSKDSLAIPLFFCLEVDGFLSLIQRPVFVVLSSAVLLLLAFSSSGSLRILLALISCPSSLPSVAGAQADSLLFFFPLPLGVVLTCPDALMQLFSLVRRDRDLTPSNFSVVRTTCRTSSPPFRPVVELPPRNCPFLAPFFFSV